jgi:hypothetical protein
MARPVPQRLGSRHRGLRARTLRDGDLRHAWLLLGAASELALNLLDAHDPGAPVPPVNVAQILHYLGNQLMVGAVKIPAP